VTKRESLPTIKINQTNPNLGDFRPRLSQHVHKVGKVCWRPIFVSQGVQHYQPKLALHGHAGIPEHCIQTLSIFLKKVKKKIMQLKQKKVE
jgi:hypothetical protein